MIIDGKKIIRVFVRRMNQTPDDDMVFIGDPPFESMIPRADEVHVSVTFTWDLKEGERLKRAWSAHLPTLIGGPAMGDPGSEFTPGLYLKHGVTITTRGCPRKCEFCFVSGREGKLRTLEIKDGHEVQDNNLMAAPMKHIERVFEMLKRQSRQARFTGGIDTRLLNEEKAAFFKDLMDTKRLDYLILAYDSEKAYKHLVKASELLSFLKRRSRVCFVLAGFQDDTVKKAEYRMRQVWDLNLTPFIMFYRDENSSDKKPSKAWKDLVAAWTDKRLIFARMIKEKEQEKDMVDVKQLELDLK